MYYITYRLYIYIYIYAYSNKNKNNNDCYYYYEEALVSPPVDVGVEAPVADDEEAPLPLGGATFKGVSIYLFYVCIYIYIYT